MRWAHDDKLFVSNSSNQTMQLRPSPTRSHFTVMHYLIQFSLAAGRHSSSY